MWSKGIESCGVFPCLRESLPHDFCQANFPYYMYNIVYRVTHCEINDEVNMQDHQLVRTACCRRISTCIQFFQLDCVFQVHSRCGARELSLVEYFPVFENLCLMIFAKNFPSLHVQYCISRNAL